MRVQEYRHEGYLPIASLGLGAGTVVGATGATIASIAATGAATTGSLLAVLGGVAVAGPIGAAVAAAIGIGVAIANLFSGCGQTCVEASNLANQGGDLMAQNLNAYLAIPQGARTQSIQAAFLNNFDTLWAAMVQACNVTQLAQAGQNCVADRQEGACKWKASPGGWVQNADGTCSYTGWGAAGSGNSCWNYFVGMRDPITNDPCVIPDPPASVTSVSSSVSDVASTAGSVLDTLVPSVGGLSGSELALLAVAGIGLFWFMGRSSS